MTLTLRVAEGNDYRRLMLCFWILTKRLRRGCGCLKPKGWKGRRHEKGCEAEYRRTGIRREARFEYFWVKEDGERNGMHHLHLCYRGHYISYERLEATWEEITSDSWKVWLQEQHDPNKTTDYLMKYITKDIGDGVNRGECYGWSQNWVYPGFVQDWKVFRRLYGKDVVRKWKEYLQGNVSFKVAAKPFSCGDRFAYRDWTKTLDRPLGRFVRDRDGHIDG